VVAAPVLMVALVKPVDRAAAVEGLLVVEPAAQEHLAKVMLVAPALILLIVAVVVAVQVLSDPAPLLVTGELVFPL
jgi:hypothetical protein